MNNINSKKEINSLTGMRFLAAFYVFIFHVHIRWPLSDNPYVAGIFSQGAVGMALFFILSGFILAYKYNDTDFKKKNEIKKYLINRFARIYPAYFFTCLLTLPLLDFSLDFSKITFLVSILILSFFALQAWFPQLFSIWNFGGTWSISVEIFLYSLLPSFLSSLKKMGKKWLLIIFLLLYIISCLPGLIQKIHGQILFPVYYAIPLYRLPEFLIGIVLFLLSTYSTRINSFYIYPFFILYAIYIAKFHNLMPDYIGHNILTIPFISFLIYHAYKSDSYLVSIISSPVFKYFGKISYSFYLMQIVVLLFAIKNKEEIDRIFSNNHSILAVVMFFLITFMSIFSFYIIENPFRKIIKRKWQIQD